MNKIYIDGFLNANNNGCDISCYYNQKEYLIRCKSYKDFKQQLKNICGVKRLYYFYPTGCEDAEGIFHFKKITVIEIISFIKAVRMQGGFDE